MKRILFGSFAALLFVTGCGETDTPDAGTDGAAAGDHAKGDDHGDKAGADKAPAADAKASVKLQGEWAISLSDEEKRSVEVLQLALKDPAPTEEDMTKMNLTDDEKMMVAFIGAAKAQDPSDPKVKEMEETAKALGSATLTVSDKEMTFKAGPTVEKATYVVESETDTSVTLKTTDADGKEDSSTITFKDEKTIELTDANDPSKKQTFVRK
ncbi:MAG: hypothetical protein H6742_21955 [Alphaproteobacteria bacterium]|nr:hypothetical protein [Alphaproteobacteria bacterium]